MLSTKYRLRLEFICKRILNHEEVSLSDMIWANKIAKSNRSADEILRKARRNSRNPKLNDGGLDDFMNKMDIGDLDPPIISNTDDIAEWFHQEKTDDWRQRD